MRPTFEDISKRNGCFFTIQYENFNGDLLTTYESLLPGGLERLDISSENSKYVVITGAVKIDPSNLKIFHLSSSAASRTRTVHNLFPYLKEQGSITQNIGAHIWVVL